MKIVCLNGVLLGQAETWCDAVKLLNKDRAVPGSFITVNLCLPTFTRTADGTYWGAVEIDVAWVFVTSPRVITTRVLEIASSQTTLVAARLEAAKRGEPGRFAEGPDAIAGRFAWGPGELQLVPAHVDAIASVNPAVDPVSETSGFRPSVVVRMIHADGTHTQVRYERQCGVLTEGEAQLRASQMTDVLIGRIVTALSADGYAPILDRAPKP